MAGIETQAKRLRAKWPKRAAFTILTVALLVALAVLWGFVIEPSMLTVTNLEIIDGRVPAAQDGLRVVFFSDLHVGSCFTVEEAERAIEKIKGLKPDLLLFGGDLTQQEKPGNEPDGARVSSAFAAIRPRYGKYAVFGNHDVWPSEMKPVARKMLEDGGFTILENTAAEPAEGIHLAGTLPWPMHTGKGGSGRQSVTWAAQNGYFTILLAHEPAQINDFKKVSFALQLSGHTHGGQVALPVIGPLAETYATDGFYAGKYRVKDTLLYVTTGVGVIDRHVRFGAPPEVVVVTLHKNNDTAQ